MNNHLAIIILLCTLKVSQCVQTWQEEPSYTEVNPSDSANLACKIYNKRGTCSWQKDGKPQGIFEGKIEWAGDQTSGDCSIRVFDAGEIDDGDWECQVTASSFSAHDALTSRIAKLVVRVPPNPPQLELGSSQVAPHHNFTARESTPATIKCLSRHGNPPARIKWFLGSEEIPHDYYTQTNATEVDRPKTWMAVSVLETSFTKNDHTRPLRCVSVHEAYGTKSKEVHVTLNVQYAPTVTLQGAPTEDIEDGIDRVALQCLADANPPANIIWKRRGEEEIFSFQETVEFNPATRKNSGTYACKATNVVGVSDPLSVRLDIKYPPRVLEVGPEPILTAVLNNRTKLQCEAESNPPPSYVWFQVTPKGRQILRGKNSTLVIENVTYNHQGQYFCQAHNIIKGSRKEDHSKPVNLEVIGAPQVMRHTAEQNVEVQKGDNALIQVAFCSDPQPLKTTWEWGSVRLHAGTHNGRYIADMLAQESGSKDCYQARLRVADVGMTDERNYYLNVQNDKGADRYAVALAVKEPVSMTTVIGIVITCLVILVIVTLGIFYAFKAEKCCFSQRGDFKPTDLETNRNDVDVQKSAHGRTNTLIKGNRQGGTLVGGSLASIPPDALYLGVPKRTASLSKLNHEYENIKTLQVPMAIQSTLMAMKKPTRNSNSSTSSTTSTHSSITKLPWERTDEPTTMRGISWQMSIPDTNFNSEINNANEAAAATLVNVPENVQGSGYSYSSFPRSFQPLSKNTSSAFSTVYPQKKDPAAAQRDHCHLSECNQRERYKPGANSPRRRPTNIVYAELQLPHASNRGSLRKGVVKPYLRNSNDRTQYAELDFKGQQILQSARI